MLSDLFVGETINPTLPGELKDALGKVASLLIELSPHKSPRYHLSQVDMARVLGISRDLVNDALVSLGRVGVIEFDRHRLLVHRPALLQWQDMKALIVSNP